MKSRVCCHAPAGRLLFLAFLVLAAAYPALADGPDLPSGATPFVQDKHSVQDAALMILVHRLGLPAASLPRGAR